MSLSKLRVPPIPKGKGTPKNLGPLADAASVSNKAKGKLKTLMKKQAFAKGGLVTKAFHRVKDYASKADARAKLDARYEGGLITQREYTQMLKDVEGSTLPDPATDMKLGSFAKGGAIKDVAASLEQLKQRYKTLPPGPERDAVVDQYSGQRRQQEQQTTDPRKRFAGGGKANAVGKLTQLMKRYEGVPGPTAPSGGAGGARKAIGSGRPPPDPTPLVQELIQRHQLAISGKLEQNRAAEMENENRSAQIIDALQKQHGFTEDQIDQLWTQSGGDFGS